MTSEQTISMKASERIASLAVNPDLLPAKGGAIRLLLHLIRLCGTSHTCEASIADLSTSISASESSTKNYLSDLIEAQFIDKHGPNIELNLELFDSIAVHPFRESAIRWGEDTNTVRSILNRVCEDIQQQLSG